MRKVIRGKLYDTETAARVAESERGYVSELDYTRETLYRKRTGEYFIHGYGHAASPYARRVGDATWGAGEAISPLTYDEARDWAERSLSADEYEREFGIPDEGAEHDLHVIVSEAAWQSLSRAASSDGTTVRAVIERLAATL